MFGSEKTELNGIKFLLIVNAVYMDETFQNKRK